MVSFSFDYSFYSWFNFVFFGGVGFFFFWSLKYYVCDTSILSDLFFSQNTKARVFRY